VNSLPKTVTQHCHGCDLNPGPSAPESSTLSTWLPSHPVTVGVIKSHRIPWEYHRSGKDDCGKIFKVRSLGLISRGKYPNFWRYPKFLITVWDRCKEAKNQPIRPVISIQSWLVTDRHMIMACTSLALRGKNESVTT